MDPEKIMTGISAEIMTALQAMSQTKEPQEKRLYSETIKNLCDSLEVFISLAMEVAPFGDEDDDSAPF
ncbi:MAG: hypothetical protein HQM14_08530 [SAR324 cluster bacterium]|nr:hypothetical protein [SAR324 cluster bacterium]